MEETVRYFNALIDSPCAIAEGELFVRNGKIVPPQAKASRSIDMHGKLIAPGFIDLQVNGGFGFDFSSHPESIGKVAEKLPSTGVTSFLATVVSLPLDSYEPALKMLSASRKSTGAECLGFHLEGPHFHASRKGAHNECAIQNVCTLDFWEKIVPHYPIKIVTLAPELRGAIKLIHYLSERGILVSCGHTEATHDELMHAKLAGIGMVTHLFNTMRGLHHRETGPIGFVLGDKAVPYSLIADGKHVNDSAIKLAWNAFPEGLILISDSSAALGLQKGHFSLGGKEIEIREHAAYLAGTDSLAGGMCPMNEMVLHLKKVTGCRLHEAIASATSKPAKLLGLEGKKGSIVAGADADFILLDPETLKVHASYVAGNLI